MYLVQLDRKNTNPSQVVADRICIDLEEGHIIGRDLSELVWDSFPKGEHPDFSFGKAQILVVCTAVINLAKEKSKTAQYANKCRTIKPNERYLAGNR